MSSCSSIAELDTADTRQIGFALLFAGEERDFIFQHILQASRRRAFDRRL